MDEFNFQTAKDIFYESFLFDPDNEVNLIYKKQLEAIKYAEKFARKGNKDAKRFILILAQGKKDTLGEFVTKENRRDAYNAVQAFFGNFVKTQCIKKFKISNPNATYSEMDEDVNGAVNSAWAEIANDFMSYNPDIAEFSTWARGRIIGGIQNYLAEKKGRKSKTTLQIDKRVYNTIEELKDEGVFSPSTALIAQKLGVSTETVKNSLLRMETENTLLSIDSLYTRDDQDGYKELNIGETLSPMSEDLFSPEKQYDLKERRQILSKAIQLLSNEEKYVLELYQGIYLDGQGISSTIDEKRLSIIDISKKLNIPENKVVKLYSNALNKMKSFIERETNEDFGRNLEEKDNFLSERTMTFAKSSEDDDLLEIIQSIDDIKD